MWAQLIAEAVKIHIGGIAGGISAGSANAADSANIRRKKNRLNYAISELDKMLMEGKIDLDQFMTRVDSFAKELGGDLQKSVQTAIARGTEIITKQQELAIGNIERSIRIAREDATGAETRELDRLGKQVRDFKQGLESTQKQARTQTTQRRLTGASAMAVLRKNQAAFNDAVGQANEVSGKIRSDIQFGLRRSLDNANKMKSDTFLRSGISQLELEKSENIRLDQGMANIKSGAFAQKEGATKGFQDLSRDIQSERIQLNSDLLNTKEMTEDEKAANVFSGIFSGASGASGGLSGAIGDVEKYYQDKKK